MHPFQHTPLLSIRALPSHLPRPEPQTREKRGAIRGGQGAAREQQRAKGKGGKEKRRGEQRTRRRIMGVPKFFRWCVERNPLALNEVQAAGVPPVDNFYLDLNGVVHNCTHANDEEASSSTFNEGDSIAKIFTYLDRLVHIIRPQKLILLAVDGVAPRAKVNQQRSRRFKSGRERMELEDAARRRGEEIPSDAFDSNCITPGTAFMARLDKHLRFYVRKKMAEDPLWQKPQVILSGPSVPGEGEHKIMEYIRFAKRDPTYAPNQRHCLYGLDADLIMLALVTHEPHFFLLREIVQYGPKGRGRPPREVLENPCAENFTLLHIGLIREYFALEFASLELPFQVDVERVIDDVVLFFMLVGNDFLPSLPTLDIAEGALDTMIGLYKELLFSQRDYLHNGGALNDVLFEEFIRKIGLLEQEVLKNRALDADTQDRRDRKRDRRFGGGGGGGGGERKPKPKPKPLEDAGGFTALAPGGGGGGGGGGEEGGEGLEEEEEDVGHSSEPTMMSTHARSLILRDAEAGVSLWKARYYRVKLGADSPLKIGQVSEEYIKGIKWVLEYYYRGVASWEWYYPYHYAPMASETRGLASYAKVVFEYGKPFSPFQQLLSVMPASSHKLLPVPYQELMLNSTSPLRHPLDYYPVDFSVDVEGKRADWEGVVLIPFINEKKLLASEAAINAARLKPEEIERNASGPILMFYYDESSCEDMFCASTLPAHFSSVTQPKSKVVMVAPPPPFPEHEKGFTAHVTKGTCTGLGNPAGFPTFQSLRVSSRHDAIKVNVFGTSSRKESIVIELQGLSNAGLNMKQIAQLLLGQKCYIDWPYLNESVICAVSDSKGKFTRGEGGKGGGGGGFKPHDSQSYERWEAEAEECVDRYLTTKAIDVGESPCFVHVRKIIGMTRLLDGSIEKLFGCEETMHPLQVTLRQNPFEKKGESIERIAGKKALQGISKGSKVIYLGHTYYGCIGTIVKQNRTGTVQLQVTPHYASEGLNASISKRVMNKYDPKYFPEGLVAKKLGVNFRTLGNVAGTIKAKDADGKTVSLGLCLKSRSHSAVVADYCRRVQGIGDRVQYQYSLTALKVLEQYKERFGWLFRALERGSQREYLLSDLLPDAKKGPDKLIEANKQLYALVTWLKKLPLSRRPMVKETAIIAPEESIRALQQAIMPAGGGGGGGGRVGGESTVLLDEVAPWLVLAPPDPTLPRPEVLTKGPASCLGDRILSVGGSARAPPFGAKGTIVGVHPNGAVEAVFDADFVGGTDLNGRVKVCTLCVWCVVCVCVCVCGGGMCGHLIHPILPITPLFPPLALSLSFSFTLNAPFRMLTLSSLSLSPSPSPSLFPSLPLSFPLSLFPSFPLSLFPSLPPLSSSHSLSSPVFACLIRSLLCAFLSFFSVSRASARASFRGMACSTSQAPPSEARTQT